MLTRGTTTRPSDATLANKTMTRARLSRADCSHSTATTDTVLLVSPIWNVRAPMIVITFIEQLDFRGKTVVPFTTHAMSGRGTTARDYARSCRGATIAEGLAARGEEVADADTDVETWLRDRGLTRS